MSTLNKIVKRIANGLGVEVHRLNTYSSPAFQLLAGMGCHNVDVVVDIGANVGQFSEELRSVGYQGRIVSFEPLSDAHAALSKNAKGDSEWIIAPRCAIGDRDGEVSLNVSGNSVSSSVLPMLEQHSQAEKRAAYIRSESVQLSRFDSLAPKFLNGFKSPLIKIDTQGFEWQVLDGMSKTFPLVAGVLCEISLVPLYEGQHLWNDVIKRLEAQGFVLWSIQQGFTDPQNGRTLQLDGIFFRK